MDTIDAIDIIDESRVVEYIILSVQGNATDVTEGIHEMQRIDASVGRAERCYHGLGAMRTQCSIGRWGCYRMMEWKWK